MALAGSTGGSLTMATMKRLRLWLARQRLAKLAEDERDHREALRWIDGERQRQKHMEKNGNQAHE